MSKDDKIHNPVKAVQLAQKACTLTRYERPDFVDTLAVAYAAVGDFEQALKIAEKALQLAQSSGNKKLAEDISKRIELYKDNQPYHEKKSK